jgi:hypothetical protein
MDPAVEVRLTELRGLHPGWGADRLRYRLSREGVEPLPSRAAIGRALVRLGLVRPGRPRRPRREYRRWERGRPMELWQLDVMGGVLLDDGGEVKAVTAIDDHSRFCLAVGLVERASSRPVCGVFARALAEFGAPESVLTDNGKVFTGRYASRPMEVLFDRICLVLQRHFLYRRHWPHVSSACPGVLRGASPHGSWNRAGCSVNCRCSTSRCRSG